MDHTDWITATGSVYAGRGARPLNPKRLATLRTKAAPAKAKLAAVSRRIAVTLAELSLQELRRLAAAQQRRRGSRTDAALPAMWQQRQRALAITRSWAGNR